MKEIDDSGGRAVTCDVLIMEENEGNCDKSREKEREREREEMMSVVE